MAPKGKQFEKAFKDSLPREYVSYRLKDAPKDFQNPNLKFSPSNIADFIIANPLTRKMHFIELKETVNTSLPFGNINFDHAEKIALMERSEFCEGYLLVRFSEKRTGTYALRIKQILEYRKEQMNSDKPKKSFSFDWISENGIELPERRLSVNYRIDVTPAFGKGCDF